MELEILSSRTLMKYVNAQQLSHDIWQDTCSR